MDCAEVRELLDAHALGALTTSETTAVDEHLAGCLACSEELEKSRQTAALLSLAVPMEQAPSRLRGRIVTQAQRAMPRAASSVPAGSGVSRHFGWRMATGAIGLAALGAFAFAGFLQVQMQDLRDDKDVLADTVASAGAEVEQQRQIVAVLAAADSQKVQMEPVVLRDAGNASATYAWSRTNGLGYLSCHDMPSLARDEQYTVWLTFQNADPAPIGTFNPSVDRCEAAIDLGGNHGRPKGIAISKEKSSSGDKPTLPWLLYADFEN